MTIPQFSEFEHYGESALEEWAAALTKVASRYEEALRRITRFDDETDATTSDKRLVLEYTVTERYYVTDKAVSAVFALPRMIEGESDRDDALIELFELHNGSQFCDSLFYHDANPQVGVEVSEEAEDA